MKKFVILVVTLFTITIGASAQKGEMSAGGSLGLGVGSYESRLGIGARFQYNVLDRLRLAPDVMYFFENKGSSLLDVNLNAHYLFPVAEKLTAYPIGGLLITRGYSYTGIGLNLGGGIQYDFTGKIAFNGELKFGIEDGAQQLVLSTGIIFKF